MSASGAQNLSVSTAAAESPSTTPTSLPTRQNTSPHYSDYRASPPIPPPRTSSSHRSRHSFTGQSSGGSSSDKKSGSRHSEDTRRRGKENNSSRRDKTATTSHPVAIHPPPSAYPAQSGNVVRSHQPRPDEASNTGSLAKEPSTIVNQLIVSDPAVGGEREHARQAGVESPTSTNFEEQPSTTSPPAGSEGVDDATSSTRIRRDGSSSRRKDTNFGQYILGQTLGEGEFGKVKLGWKKDGSVQVAIKMIRREILGSNPSRLPKIYREISILRGLAHPNIVRLHEMVETDRHIGIIMEYASGGELFDYILNNRYLKDNPARRLFAQLVSGVGYLHKKGIVHRDLKLENLLLDRNRNIIITDFGFANTFDPNDQLSEEVEYNLSNKDYVRRYRLHETNSKGMRHGDLMQTSCGSPCYAAPELVVSDSLYTGRKVDVWSCGVILVSNIKEF